MPFPVSCDQRTNWTAYSNYGDSHLLGTEVCGIFGMESSFLRYSVMPDPMVRWPLVTKYDP